MPFLPPVARALAALPVAALLVFNAGCAAREGAAAGTAPPLSEFCLEAQRVVVRTEAVPTLIVHPDFDGFVKSKAAIEPLTIHQYVWYEDDDPARPVMVSCKLKSADHLNEAFGKGTSAGDGRCQDMNRLTYNRVRATLGASNVEALVFDPAEEVRNVENPGMTGPDWLKPYEMTWRDDSGVLHLRSKGFRVDWTDPRFAAMPGKFRGVQYCHLVAPEYLARLVTGKVRAGITVGRDVSALPAPSAQ
ncbi:MAG: hypothetical protein ABI661_01700 [Gammaproteobacteria bacterium]